MQPGRYFWTRIPHWLLSSVLPRGVAFFRRPWTVGETFWVAASLGLVLPVLNAPFFRWLPWRIVPFVFFPFVGILVAQAYRRVERGHFRTDWQAMLAASGAGLLWAAGAVGSGWCFHHHICMGGHMAHPPYPSWHYAFDGGWALAVLLAAVWMRSVRVSLCILFATLSAYLVSYRFIFGSFGGMYAWLPL
jgi:hypothetical protein